MSTGYYLLDHPNPHAPKRANGVRMFAYPTRKVPAGTRHPVLAAVVHITAGLQDDDHDYRSDSSAEDTARYAATTERSVSWQSGSDANSSLLLLPDDYTAFQCVGYNSRTIGHEISKRDITWADEDPKWVSLTLQEAADCLRPRLKKLHIPIKHATKSELDRAITTNGNPVGLVDHSRLDPDRRRDPGPDFPWIKFLLLLAQTPVPPKPQPPTPTPAPPEEEEMKYQRFIVNNLQQYLALPEGLVVIKNQTHLGLLKKAGHIADGEPIPVTQADVDLYGVL